MFATAFFRAHTSFRAVRALSFPSLAASSSFPRSRSHLLPPTRFAPSLLQSARAFGVSLRFFSVSAPTLDSAPFFYLKLCL
eukprot:6198259-Pleurochrysis_carterae.AAC.1